MGIRNLDTCVAHLPIIIPKNSGGLARAAQRFSSGYNKVPIGDLKNVILLISIAKLSLFKLAERVI